MTDPSIVNYLITHKVFVVGTVAKLFLLSSLRHSPQELMAVRAVGWSTEEFLDEVMALDGLYLSLATVDGSPTTSKGSGILWEGG